MLVSLYDSALNLIVQDEGVSLSDLTASIDQHLAGSATGNWTTYFLEVQPLHETGASQSYQLKTTFEASSPPFQPLTPSATGFATADLNGDGFLDLVTIDTSTDAESPFGPLAIQGTYSDASLLEADFNGDSVKDLGVVVTMQGASVTELLLNRDGSLLNLNPIDLNATNALDPAAADFNGDGRADLVSIGQGGGVHLSLSNPAGGLDTQVLATPGLSPQYVFAGDFTGNGLQDIAIVNGSGLGLTVLLGDGTGAFPSASWPTTALPADIRPSSVLGGKINGDSRTDLVLADAANNQYVVLTGKGDGTFTRIIPGSDTIRSNPLVADLNGDGVQDSVVLDSSGAIHFRRGLGGAQLGFFGSSQALNGDSSDPATFTPANDIALVSGPTATPSLRSMPPVKRSRDTPGMVRALRRPNSC